MQSQKIAVQVFFGLAPLTYAKGGPLDKHLPDMVKKYGVGASAVLMRWQLNQNVISISTSKKPERLLQYFAAIDLKLTGEEMEEITRAGLTHHARIRLADKFDPEERS